MKQLLATILLISVAHFANAKEVSVQKVDEGNYRLTLTHSTVLDIGIAQAYLYETAKSLCGTLSPHFGKYSFAGSEAIEKKVESAPTFEFVQDIQCANENSESTAVAMKYLTSESEAQAIRNQVLVLSETYFNDIASSKFDKAYSVLADSMRSFSTKTSWVSEKNTFQSQVGDPRQITISKLTLYDNPPGAPNPGIYVAADYYNEFSNAPIHCGYVMWFKGQDGNFKIIREESGLVTSEQLAAIPTEQLPIVKQRLRCVTP